MRKSYDKSHALVTITRLIFNPISHLTNNNIKHLNGQALTLKVESYMRR